MRTSSSANPYGAPLPTRFTSTVDEFGFPYMETITSSTVPTTTKLTYGALVKNDQSNSSAGAGLVSSPDRAAAHRHTSTATTRTNLTMRENEKSSAHAVTTVDYHQLHPAAAGNTEGAAAGDEFIFDTRNGHRSTKQATDGNGVNALGGGRTQQEQPQTTRDTFRDGSNASAVARDDLDEDNRTTISLDSAGVAQFERLMNRAAAYGNRIRPFLDPNERPTSVVGSSRSSARYSSYSSAMLKIGTGDKLAEYVNGGGGGEARRSVSSSSAADGSLPSAPPMIPSSSRATSLSTQTSLSRFDREYPLLMSRQSDPNYMLGSNTQGRDKPLVPKETSIRGANLHEQPSKATVSLEIKEGDRHTEDENTYHKDRQMRERERTSHGNDTHHYSSLSSTLTGATTKTGTTALSAISNTGTALPSERSRSNSSSSSSSAVASRGGGKGRENHSPQSSAKARAGESKDAHPELEEKEGTRKISKSRQQQEEELLTILRRQTKEEREAILEKEIESLRAQQTKQQTDLEKLMAMNPSEVPKREHYHAIVRPRAHSYSLNANGSTAAIHQLDVHQQVDKQPLAKYSMVMDSSIADVRATRGLISENDWLKQRLKTLAVEYEDEIDRREALLEKALREGKKLKKKLAYLEQHSISSEIVNNKVVPHGTSYENNNNSNSLAIVSIAQDLKHSNERLSAQLARLSLLSVSGSAKDGGEGINKSKGGRVESLHREEYVSDYEGEKTQRRRGNGNEPNDNSRSLPDPSHAFVVNSQSYKLMESEKDAEIRRLKQLVFELRKRQSELEAKLRVTDSAKSEKNSSAVDGNEVSVRRGTQAKSEANPTAHIGGPRSAIGMGGTEDDHDDDVLHDCADEIELADNDSNEQKHNGNRALPSALISHSASAALSVAVVAPAVVSLVDHQQQQQRVIECEAAIDGLMYEIEGLETRLREQVRRSEDERHSLQMQLESQQSAFNVERLECDRVVHALSAKLEELVKENAAIRRKLKAQQPQ